MENSKMKAIGLSDPGYIKDLKVLELPIPDIGSHDLLVEIKAVSLNPIDLKQLKGTDPTTDIPTIPGYDASGIVVKIGSDVKNFKVGDDVY